MSASQAPHSGETRYAAWGERSWARASHSKLNEENSHQRKLNPSRNRVRCTSSRAFPGPDLSDSSQWPNNRPRSSFRIAPRRLSKQASRDLDVHPPGRSVTRRREIHADLTVLGRTHARCFFLCNGAQVNCTVFQVAHGTAWVSDLKLS